MVVIDVHFFCFYLNFQAVDDFLAQKLHFVEHRIDVWGVQERVEEFCDRLQARFGWDLGPPVFMNRTTPAPASGALRARIEQDNALDVELYRRALILDPHHTNGI